MTKFHIFLFNETVYGQFFGYNRKVSISELPVWCNFRVEDVLEVSNMKELPFTKASLDNSNDVQRIFDLLDSASICDNIVIGRAGNIFLVDWLSLASGLENPKGIMKMQAGKVPSEFYYMKKRDLIRLLKDNTKAQKIGKSSVLRHLFDKVLFFQFERIIESPGFSFLIRNSFEYYCENLRFISRLLDSNFTHLYATLRAPSLTSTVVGKNAVVKNSVLGNGTRVDGIVEDSVIFNGVTVGKNTKIKNSVILPANQVEDDVYIERALVLGGSNRVIKEGAVIGSNTGAQNRDFPEVIKNGLTIIGEDITIPEGSQIGSGCLVHGKWDKSLSPVIVEEGTSFSVG